MPEKQKVFNYIEQNRKKISEFLKDVISKASINEGDGGDGRIAQGWLVDKLKEYKFDKIDKFALDKDCKSPNVCSVLKGSGSGKSILFNGHMDVVPVADSDSWICDPFKPISKDGKIFGRGSSDMKGGITSAVWAMKAIKDLNIELKGDVVLHSVMGEESQMAENIGTVQCIKKRYNADFGIVCEPSDMELHIVSSALVFFEIIIEGKGVHISARNKVLFPQSYNNPSGMKVGVDAIKKSLKFVNYFYELEEQWNHRYRDKILGSGGKPRHDNQGVGVFTINPSFVEGGEYLGTIPSKVKYTYGVWYPDYLVSKEEVFNEIKQAVKAISSTDDWLKKHPPKLNMPVIQDWPGFRISEDHPGVIMAKRSIEDALGQPAIISGFKAVCDAYYLNKYGVPSVIFGPGSVDWGVHGANEYVTIDNVIDAAKVYASIIMDWVNQ